jgi:crotonobetainyl-CoA:carnitine CoA-transferase CaiB-like acyl-CoA transferase
VAGRNPRLVYGLITGYGMAGPDADRAAYDIAAFWARAGVADLLTRPGDTPPFQRGGMGTITNSSTAANTTVDKSAVSVDRRALDCR